jgi:hypothetical protein
VPIDQFDQVLASLELGSLACVAQPLLEAVAKSCFAQYGLKLGAGSSAIAELHLPFLLCRHHFQYLLSPLAVISAHCTDVAVASWTATGDGEGDDDGGGEASGSRISHHTSENQRQTARQQTARAVETFEELRAKSL